MEAGEQALHHIVVAWRGNDGDESSAIDPWLAVDTTATALLRAAPS